MASSGRLMPYPPTNTSVAIDNTSQVYRNVQALLLSGPAVIPAGTNTDGNLV